MTKRLAAILGLAPPPLAVLDVGALATTEERYAPLVAGGARIIGVEPNKAAVRDLLELFPDRQFMAVALGDGTARTFHHCRYPGNSSLYEPDLERLHRFSGLSADFEVVRTELLRTVRLDEVPGLPAFDYLKIDVQGAELDVLRGAERALASAVVLDVEVSFLPLYKGQPLFGEVDEHLRARGFFLHSLADLMGRCYYPFTNAGRALPPVGQILQADAVYVRDLDWLTAGADDRLLAAATILHDVYRSYDLVGWLLQRRDERRHSQLCEAYRAHLLSERPPPPRLLNVLAETDSIVKPPPAG